ncbi:MAG: hypothetical protein CL912_16435 [Deltaproteobacteria bacterium]|nr:hypothetical protein [Deltaproteobacteria bacterium]
MMENGLEIWTSTGQLLGECAVTSSTTQFTKADLNQANRTCGIWRSTLVIFFVLVASQEPRTSTLPQSLQSR